MVNDLLRKELKTKKFRITAQRELIMKVFSDHFPDHLSIEEVYRNLLEKRSRISKATVYRTVELLSTLGLLRKIPLDNDITRYELASKETAGTSLAVCTECGKTVQFSEKALVELNALIAKETGFEHLDTHLKVYGVCSDCRK